MQKARQLLSGTDGANQRCYCTEYAHNHFVHLRHLQCKKKTWTSTATIESRYGFVFKSKQVESIKSIVSGNDTFIVLPTGYGKSKIYNEHN